MSMGILKDDVQASAQEIYDLFPTELIDEWAARDAKEKADKTIGETIRPIPPETIENIVAEMSEKTTPEEINEGFGEGFKEGFREGFKTGFDEGRLSMLLFSVRSISTNLKCPVSHAMDLLNIPKSKRPAMADLPEDRQKQRYPETIHLLDCRKLKLGVKVPL